MAWQIEREHVDLAEMTHVTVFVEPSLKTRGGTPPRHELVILLGPHGLSTTRGANSGNLTLAADGTLKDPDGNDVDVAAKQRETLAQLTALHAAGRAYARKHNKAIFAGPGK